MQPLKDSAPYDPGVPIDPELARRLRREARLADEHRNERNRLFREAREAGASWRELEKVVEERVTHVGIKRIVERKPD